MWKLQGGSWEGERRGCEGERVAVASGSGSNYRTVSILSHLTAAWNTHHSSHHSPTDQINSRADKGRAQSKLSSPEAPSLISSTLKECLLFIPMPILSLGLYLCPHSLLRENLKNLRADPQTSRSHVQRPSATTGHKPHSPRS